MRNFCFVAHKRAADSVDVQSWGDNEIRQRFHIVCLSVLQLQCQLSLARRFVFDSVPVDWTRLMPQKRSYSSVLSIVSSVSGGNCFGRHQSHRCGDFSTDKNINRCAQPVIARKLQAIFIVHKCNDQSWQVQQRRTIIRRSFWFVIGSSTSDLPFCSERNELCANCHLKLKNWKLPTTSATKKLKRTEPTHHRLENSSIIYRMFYNSFCFCFFIICVVRDS